MNKFIKIGNCVFRVINQLVPDSATHYYEDIDNITTYYRVNESTGKVEFYSDVYHEWKSSGLPAKILTPIEVSDGK